MPNLGSGNHGDTATYADRKLTHANINGYAIKMLANIRLVLRGRGKHNTWWPGWCCAVPFSLGENFSLSPLGSYIPQPASQPATEQLLNSMLGFMHETLT